MRWRFWQQPTPAAPDPEPELLHTTWSSAAIAVERRVFEQLHRRVSDYVAQRFPPGPKRYNLQARDIQNACYAALTATLEQLHTEMYQCLPRRPPD